MRLSEIKQADQDAEVLRKEMWNFLKQQSKKDLMRTIFEQINMYRELQAMSKQLLEENEELKKQLAPAPTETTTDDAKEPS